MSKENPFNSKFATDISELKNEAKRERLSRLHALFTGPEHRNPDSLNEKYRVLDYHDFRIEPLVANLKQAATPEEFITGLGAAIDDIISYFRARQEHKATDNQYRIRGTLVPLDGPWSSQDPASPYLKLMIISAADKSDQSNTYLANMIPDANKILQGYSRFSAEHYFSKLDQQHPDKNLLPVVLSMIESGKLFPYVLSQLVINDRNDFTALAFAFGLAQNAHLMGLLKDILALPGVQTLDYGIGVNNRNAKISKDLLSAKARTRLDDLDVAVTAVEAATKMANHITSPKAEGNVAKAIEKILVEARKLAGT